MSDWNDDEPVGYGRPPTHGRFRKGESGNPEGRPRKKRRTKQTSAQPELDAMIEEVLGQRVSTTVRGEPTEIPLIQAIIHTQAAEALKGNTHAQRQSIKLHGDAERRRIEQAAVDKEADALAKAQEAQEEEQLFRYLRNLRQRQADAWKSAIAAGQLEPAEPWPHPDDIILEKCGTKYRVRGPLDQAGVAGWELIKKIRDYHLVELVLAIEAGASSHLVKLWTIFLVEQDMHLPRRWQISRDLDAPMMRLMAKPYGRLKAMARELADETGIHAQGSRRSKDAYREANKLFAPMLKVVGYRSLAQFERAGLDSPDGFAPIPGPEERPRKRASSA